MFQKEVEFYKNARIADEGLHTFQLCGQMDHDPSDRWAVAGEVGYEWLEVHEVGFMAFNYPEDHENYDGAFYYVGTTALEPLRPPHSEIEQAVKHVEEFGWDLGYSAKLGQKLLSFPEVEPLTFEPNIQNDNLLKKLWKDFGDFPVDENECLDISFLHFPAGTHREVVWRWFDTFHSKGVGYISEEIDETL